MCDTRVKYLGLELKNPVVVASCGLTDTPEKIAACEEAGAAAVVVKSIFQEEIDETIRQLDSSNHPESHDYIAQMQTGFDIERYCNVIREAKRIVEIPVIGSVNAFRQEWWVERLPQLEAAGADAIELNLSLLPQDYHTDEAQIRNWYSETVRQAASSVSVPLAVKIGPHFTSIPQIADELHRAGAKGIVMFNRFYPLDIDIDHFKLRSGQPFSTSGDLVLPMRWISLLYGHCKLELAASSGVHQGEDLIKILLSGAQIAQVCSVIYREGYESIQKLLDELHTYMKKHHFDTIKQFRGKVSQSQSYIPEDFERMQYIKTLTSVRS